MARASAETTKKHRRKGRPEPIEGRVAMMMARHRRKAFEEGVLRGQHHWLLIGGFAWTVWLVRRAWKKEAEVVYRTKLLPNETLTIATYPKNKKR